MADCILATVFLHHFDLVPMFHLGDFQSIPVRFGRLEFPYVEQTGFDGFENHKIIVAIDHVFPF